MWAGKGRSRRPATENGAVSAETTAGGRGCCEQAFRGAEVPAWGPRDPEGLSALGGHRPLKQGRAIRRQEKTEEGRKGKLKKGLKTLTAQINEISYEIKQTKEAENNSSLSH